MIQLASKTEADTSRLDLAAANDGKANSDTRRRPGHAWPFMSRAVGQVVEQPIAHAPTNSGS